MHFKCSILLKKEVIIHCIFHHAFKTAHWMREFMRTSSCSICYIPTKCLKWVNTFCSDWHHGKMIFQAGNALDLVQNRICFNVRPIASLYPQGLAYLHIPDSAPSLNAECKDSAMICLCIHVVWWGLSLFICRLIGPIECTIGEQMPEWDFAHTQDKSEFVPFAHVWRHFFAWCGPYIFAQRHQ